MVELKIFKHFMKDFHEINTFLEDLPLLGQPVSNKRKKRLNPFTDLTEAKFKKYYHFSTENMRRIIDMIHDDLIDDTSIEIRANQVPVEIQIMAAIRLFAGEHPQLVAMAHTISTKTLNKICKRVSKALSTLASIRMPATLSEKERVTKAFSDLAGMPQVIGAIKQFKVHLKRSNLVTDATVHYEITNNSSEYLQVQIICDASLKIRNLDCQLRSKEEKYVPSEIFRHTRKRFEQNEFRGRVILADHNLQCCSFLFTPVKCPITKEEQAFNKAHSATFSTVQNCIELWRRRFPILDSGIYFNSASAAKQTITALALLHNMGIEWIDNSIDFTSNDAGHLSAENCRNVHVQARTDFIQTYFSS